MKIKALIALMLLVPLVIGSVAYAGDTVTVEQAIDAPEAVERYFGMSDRFYIFLHVDEKIISSLSVVFKEHCSYPYAD